MKLQMDKLAVDTNKVLVIAATSRPERIDHTFHGRLQMQFRIDGPDTKGRIEILRSLLANVNHDLKKSDFDALGDETRGLGVHDLRTIISALVLKKLSDARCRRHFREVSILIHAALSHDR